MKTMEGNVINKNSSLILQLGLQQCLLEICKKKNMCNALFLEEYTHSLQETNQNKMNEYQT